MMPVHMNQSWSMPHFTERPDGKVNTIQFLRCLMKLCFVLGFPLAFFLIGVGFYTLYHPMKMLELLMYCLGILAILAGLYLMVRLTIIFVKHNDPDTDNDLEKTEEKNHFNISQTKL